jgi:hypothetical protein
MKRYWLFSGAIYYPNGGMRKIIMEKLLDCMSVKVED